MTIRRFLYPSLFVAFAPPPLAPAATGWAFSADPFVVQFSKVVSDNLGPPKPAVQAPTPFFEPPRIAPARSWAVLADDMTGTPSPPVSGTNGAFPQDPVQSIRANYVPQQRFADFVFVPPVAAVTAVNPAFAHDAFVTQTSLIISEMRGSFVSVVAVQPYGAFPQDPVQFVKGFSAKLAQDGADFTSFGVSFTPPIFTQSPERFWKATYPAFRQQDGSDNSPLPIAVPTPGWQFQWPDLFLPPFAVKLQWQGSDFPAQGAIVSVTPQGFWTQLPVLFVKPLPAAQQRFQDFVPRGTIVIPQYGAFPQYPDIFAKPFPVKLQWARDDFPASSIAVTTPATQGAYVQDPVLFGKPFSVTQQRFGDFTAAGTIVSITPQGWWGRWPDAFAKPFPVSLQHPIGFAPAGNLVSTPQGWWGQSPVLFARPIPISLQRFGSDFAPPAPIAVPTPGWQFQWPDLFHQPFAVKLQWQGNDFPAQGTIVSTTPQGWMFQSPERFIKPLPAAQQRFPDYATAGFIAVTPPFIQTPYFQYPERFIRPLSAAQQRFPDFTPAGTIVSVTPQGWMFQPPALFARPLLGAYLQRFSDAAPRSYAFTAAIFTQWPERFWKANYPSYLQQRGEAQLIRPPVVTPQGWWGQPPALFARRYPVQLQKFSDLHSFVRIAATPSFFSWTYSPERFVRPLKAAEQMFSGWMPFSPPPPVFVAQLRGRYEPPLRFIKPLPAALQQFTGWEPFNPVIISPPGEGEFLKNEVERTRWLAGGKIRVRWVLNDIIRRRDLN